MKFDMSPATGVAEPGDVPGMMVAAASELGATNLVVYLVDFEQRLLEPIRDQSAQSALPEAEEVGVSVAGPGFHRAAGAAIRTRRRDPRVGADY